MKQLNVVSWVKDGKNLSVLSSKSITKLVSDIADEVYKNSPIVKREMLNRDF